MAAHTDRLRQAVDTYRRWQSKKEGGWGEDRWGTPGIDAPCSIVNTAEVLSVLKAANVPYEDAVVQRGLAYLSEAVRTHPQRASRPSAAGSDRRGAHARYASFGLLGLTLYKESRHDASWLPAQTACLEWLDRNQMVTGAWREHPANEHPSLTSTHAATVGLSRICPRGRFGKRADELVAAAQRTVLGLSEQQGRVRWWRNTPKSRTASPAATALAVLILSRGGEHRQPAAEGSRWLYERVDEWVHLVEGDSHMKGANWKHMTFSLALRAVLSPAARYSADDPAFAGSIAFLDELWHPDQGEWRHGDPASKCSPTGSCAVVLAAEAIRRAWPFDPTRPRGSSSSRRRRQRILKPDVTVRLTYPWVATVTDLHGEQVAECELPEKILGPFLGLLALRRSNAGTSAGLEARSLSANELARALNPSRPVKPDTIRRYADRVNEKLQVATEHKRQIGFLVQRMGTSADPGELRWGLNADEVELDGDARERLEALRS